MSLNKVKLCSFLLVEQFGEIVAKVGGYLLNKGSSSLRFISQGTNLNINQVKKSLTILIHHNLCTFEEKPPRIALYSVNCDAVLCCLHYSRYVYCAKSLYDVAGELIVEELVQRGRSALSDVVVKAKEQLNEALESQGSAKVSSEFVGEKFNKFVKLQFIKRVITPRKSNNDTAESSTISRSGDEFKCLTSDEFNLAIGGKRKSSGSETENLSKRRKIETVSEQHSYWRINPPRFHQFIRDQLFVNAISHRIDDKAGEVVRAMLRLSEVKTHPESCVTVPVSVHEIFSTLSSNAGLTKSSLNQYLKILIDDSSGLVSKVDESSGGIYSINILKGLSSLAKAHIESLLLEKYGSKSLRIFRLLLLRRHAEQKQIEDSVMMNVKEVKELLYRLYTDGFIIATELCKTPDHAPARTTFLFSVDIAGVARMVVERCYKAINNSIMRRNHEVMENKRLLDKQQRVEAITASLASSGASDEQKAEVEQLLTPAEKSLIEKVSSDIKKLDQCEMQVGETLFVLSFFLQYEVYNKTVKVK